MNNLIAYRKPNIWKNLLAFLIAITFMIVWLPFIRSIFDGETYEWGTSYFGLFIGGKGVTVAFVFLIIQMAFYLTLMYSFYWVQNRLIFYILLTLWFINSFGNLLFEIIQDGDAMFHGDTMNIHISIMWIVLPLALLALLLVIKVIQTDSNSPEEHILWNKKNLLWTYIIVGALPFQFILLYIGEPHETTDEIGVIISIAQCYALPFLYKPWKNK